MAGSPRREKTLVKKLEDITTDKKARWILWKYGVMYKGLSFEEISKKFLGGIDEDIANEYLYEEEVQKAIKVLLKILHNQKMIELYNIYFERAKDDTQAFKAFIDFSGTFFADEAESELTAILNNIDLGDNDE